MSFREIQNWLMSNSTNSIISSYHHSWFKFVGSRLMLITKKYQGKPMKKPKRNLLKTIYSISTQKIESLFRLKFHSPLIFQTLEQVYSCKILSTFMELSLLKPLRTRLGIWRSKTSIQLCNSWLSSFTSLETWHHQKMKRTKRMLRFYRQTFSIMTWWEFANLLSKHIIQGLITNNSYMTL